MTFWFVCLFAELCVIAVVALCMYDGDDGKNTYVVALSIFMVILVV